MRILKLSLILVLSALLAGYVAWIVIPCQPRRSFSVPVGTKLLEFSPGGRYVVTFRREESRLILWHPATGQEAFATEMPCIVRSNESTNVARAFYGFSADDHLLAVAVGTPDDPHLIIVDLDSGNTQEAVTDLAGNLGRYPPQPAFSSDGRYLSYFGTACVVLFGITAKEECLRLEGFSGSLGPPTPQGKWLLEKGKDIECWDVNQKRRDWALPQIQVKHAMTHNSLSPDEQAVTGLAVVESRSPDQRISHYHLDLKTEKVSEDWAYNVPTSARLLWNLNSSDPIRFFLIKTFDDQGKLVEDLVDIDSGMMLVRYPQPIDMLEDMAMNYQGQILHNDAGLILTLGRQGETAIDSQRRVIVSKKINRETTWWRNFGRQLRWLGIRQPPPQLHLQFHSAESGKLLERVSIHTPYQPFDPVLAMHPVEPAVAMIDEQPEASRLQFWQAPPPKPWFWIMASSLAGAAIALLLWMGLGKVARKTALFKKA